MALGQSLDSYGISTRGGTKRVRDGMKDLVVLWTMHSG